MALCPTCHISYSGAARICRNCSTALPDPGVADPAEVVELVLPTTGIRVCTYCGRCVPAKQATCTLCRNAPRLALHRDASQGPQPPPATRVVSPRPDGAYWVRVGADR